MPPVPLIAAIGLLYIYAAQTSLRVPEPPPQRNTWINILIVEKALRLGMGIKKPIFETAKEFGFENIMTSLQSLAKDHSQFYEPDPLLESMK